MTYKYSFDYSCQISRHISYIYIIIVLGNKRACLCMTYGQSFRGNGSKQSLKKRENIRSSFRLQTEGNGAGKKLIHLCGPTIAHFSCPINEGQETVDAENQILVDVIGVAILECNASIPTRIKVFWRKLTVPESCRKLITGL